MVGRLLGNKTVSTFTASINGHIYGHIGPAAHGRAAVTLGAAVVTRENGGGREERESENKDRGSTSEHFEFFVEWKKLFGKWY